MSDFNVEASVPIPEKFRGRKSKYPIDTMQVGESFSFAPGLLLSIRSAVGRAQIKHKGRSYSVRVDPSDQSRYRCWRLR